MNGLSISRHLGQWPARALESANACVEAGEIIRANTELAGHDIDAKMQPSSLPQRCESGPAEALLLRTRAKSLGSRRLVYGMVPPLLMSCSCQLQTKLSALTLTLVERVILR